MEDFSSAIKKVNSDSNNNYNPSVMEQVSLKSAQVRLKSFMDQVRGISPLKNEEKNTFSEKTNNTEENKVVAINLENTNSIEISKNENDKASENESQKNIEENTTDDKKNKKNLREKRERNHNENTKSLLSEKEIENFNNFLERLEKIKIEIEDISTYLKETKEGLGILKQNTKKELESYTDEVLAGASQQAKALYNLMEKVLVKWKDYYLIINDDLNVKGLKSYRGEKKEKKLFLLYFLLFFIIILLLFLIFKTK